MDKHVLGEAKRIAQAANLPKGFIDHLRIEKNGTSYTLVNDWELDDGTPLADYFEHGTNYHWIEPKVINTPSGRAEPGHQSEKSFGDKGDQHVSEPKFLHWKKDGLNFFSSGHFVRGIQAFKTMEFAVQIGVPQVVEEIEGLKKVYEN